MKTEEGIFAPNALDEASLYELKRIGSSIKRIKFIEILLPFLRTRLQVQRRDYYRS